MICKIHRDFDTEEVIRVEAPNGTDSKLYKDALSITEDREEALNIWSAAYTPAFKERFGDWEGGNTLLPLKDTVEPSIDVVMRFINTDNESKLNLTEAVDVLKTLQKTGLTGDSLLTNLQNLFFNSKGQFVVDRKKLVSSGMYTEEEVRNIMSYPSVRQEVKETISKLRNSLLEDTTVFSTVSARIPAEHPLLISTERINSLGMMETLPVTEVENYIVTSFGTYTSEEEFNERLNALDREDIRDAILANPESIEYVRDLTANLKPVPVISLKDGVLQAKMINDSYETLANTLTVNVEKIDFTEAIDDLRTVPEDLWYEDDTFIQSILKNAEIRAADAGLDLDGLTSMYYQKTQEEIIGFLDLIDDFNIKTEDLTVTDADIVELSNDINEFFGRNEQPDMRTAVIPEAFQGKVLIMLDQNLKETDVYRTDGLVKAYGNMYQRVDSFNNYAAAVEETYNAILQDVSILPLEAFQDFGLKQGYYDVDAIVNPINKDKVISSINNYITRRTAPIVSQDLQDYETNREIELMKTLFNPSEINEELQDDVADRAFSFTGDLKYLTSDFITDFYVRMLDEKVIKKSELWDTALKYFTVNNKGIDVQPLSAEMEEQIKLVLQSEPILYNNLSNYALISKNENLAFLREFTPGSRFNDIQNRRDFIMNYPQAIEKFSRPYTKIGETTLLAKNSTDEFIKTNEGIFELTSSDNGVSIYSKVEATLDPNYFLFGSSAPVVEEVYAETFKEETPDTVVDKAHSVSTKALTQTKENLTCMV